MMRIVGHRNESVVENYVGFVINLSGSRVGGFVGFANALLKVVVAEVEAV
jgi:hypothetical protein